MVLKFLACMRLAASAEAEQCQAYLAGRWRARRAWHLVHHLRADPVGRRHHRVCY